MTLTLPLPRACLRATFAFFVGASFLCFPAYSAQNPSQKPVPEPAQESKSQPPYRMAVHVDLVDVEVTVTDAHGNFVGGLARENFRVLDEGVPQPLTHFASVETPAQVLVLVETGPAVYLIHREHLLAAYALLEGLAPDDRVALGTYDQSARLTINFTADKNGLAGVIDGLRYSLGMAELNLFDSLGVALDWLAPLPGKKAIVLLSTGLDTSVAGRYEALLEKLRASDVVILPVALGGELREPPGKSDKKPSGKNDKKKGAPTPPPYWPPMLGGSASKRPTRLWRPSRGRPEAAPTSRGMRAISPASTIKSLPCYGISTASASSLRCATRVSIRSKCKSWTLATVCLPPPRLQGLQRAPPQQESRSTASTPGVATSRRDRS